MHRFSRTTILLSFLFVALSAATPLPAAGGDIVTTLRNDSLFDGVLQVRDDVCGIAPETGCSDARLSLRSPECLDNPASQECRNAREVYDSACGCETARATLDSRTCRERPSAPECMDARSKADSASCQAGVIFEGSVPGGARVSLALCATPAGYGQVSVRDIRKGPVWKNYRLLSDGDTIGYP